MAIRRADSRFRRWSFFLTVVFLVHQAALGEGTYTAQVRGTVTDPAHAVVNNAKVTVTNESTSIATICDHCDRKRLPASRSLRL